MWLPAQAANLERLCSGFPRGHPWRLSTTFGHVFVEIRMMPQPGSDASNYIDMTGWSTDQ